jgi:uncharacterized membrane protein
VPAAKSGAAACASIVLLGAVPFMADRAMPDVSPEWLGGVIPALQITAIAWLLTGKWMFRHRAALIIGLLAAMGVLLHLPGLPPRTVELVAAGGCHAAAYCGLLIWFCRSLRPGREPAVTGFARRVRRSMPAKVVRYTRQVTIAWCLFFAAQLLVSAALLASAPIGIWVTFVKLLNVPLLVAMMLAEFGCRLILFRHEPHTSLINTLVAMRYARATSVDQR